MKKYEIGEKVILDSFKCIIIDLFTEKTILCLVNDYVNSLDLRRTVLSASDGLRSYKKAFETRKYRVVFTVSPTAMSGLILTYNHHYLLKNSNNKVSYNQLRFNTESKEIESKDYYNPLGIPYDTPTRKYFVSYDFVSSEKI
ncbi:MAG: hypothetical protein ACLRMQ_10535 [Clostridium perfringens]